MPRSISLVMALVGAVGLVLSPAAPVRAQALAAGDTLVFEPLGDRPIDADDLAFDTSDTLWASASEVYRLAPGAGVWEEVTERGYHYVLPLDPDTLLLGGNGVRRALDGGLNFTEVAENGEVLFEAASGTLLAGLETASGVAYSPDRGQTWTTAAFDTGTWIPAAEAFTEIPAGHPDAGRLIGACWGGLSYSDDDGRRWMKSSLWTDDGRYLVVSVTVGVGGRVYAAFSEIGVAGTQIARSDDGGRTYAVVYGFGVSVGVTDRIVSLAGGANPELGVVVLVEYDGSVWRSDDGALSWRQVGQVPLAAGGERKHISDAALDSQGRLYVAGHQLGSDREWVYRTTGVVVGNEPAPAPVETGARLEVVPNPFRGEAAVTFAVGESSRVRVSLYDVLGREVAVLADGPRAPGRYEAAFDGRGLAAGVYVVRATVATAAGTRRSYVARMTLLR